MSEGIGVERIIGKIDPTTKHILEDSWLFEYFLQHKIREVSELRHLLRLIDDLTSPISILSSCNYLVVIPSHLEYISILEDDIVIDEPYQ